MKKNRFSLQNRDLFFYIGHGMRVTKIHTVYQFMQSPWLTKYFKFDKYQRIKAKTGFEKPLLNLMISFLPKTN